MGKLELVLEAVRQIRVGNVVATVRNEQLRISSSQSLALILVVVADEAAGADHRALPHKTHEAVPLVDVHARDGRHRHVVGLVAVGDARLDDRHVGEVRVVLLQEAEEARILAQCRARRAPAASTGPGTETNADLLRVANSRNNGVYNLAGEQSAVLSAATILIGAVVRGRTQKLLDQVAVGAMDLHTVKAGNFHRTLRGIGELLDVLENLRPRKLVRSLLSLAIAVVIGDGTGRNRGHGIAALAAHSPDLLEDVRVLLVHGFRHLLPALGLLLRPDTGEARVAAGLLRNRGRLGDQKTARGGRTLAIVDGLVVRGLVGLRVSHTRERSKHHTVLQLHVANFKRFEKH